MTVQILVGDCRERMKELPDKSIHCCVTSPPYWGLRDYGLPPLVWGGEEGCGHRWGEKQFAKDKGDTKTGFNARYFGKDIALGKQAETAKHKPDTSTSQGQFCQLCSAWRGSLGLEPALDLYVAHLVEVMREVKRVLRDDGTLWLNLGDSYASSTKGSGGCPEGSITFNRPNSIQKSQHFDPRKMDLASSGLKPKDLVGIPWHVAFALQADGWWLRSDIIWQKPNCMPESIRDRPTKAHEYLFLLSKSSRYYYDRDAVLEPRASGRGTRNRRTVWTIPTKPYEGAHFAAFPPALIEPCIKAGTSERGVCPECGAGWVRVRVKTGHVNKREPAHVPNNCPTKVDSTGWAPTSVATDGWCPGCGCDAGDPIPATVLDHFGGSGTVGVVCDQLGRDAILYELNPDYILLAEERVRRGGIE